MVIRPWPRTCSKFFLGVISGLSLGTCTWNLKSVTLTVLELLAFSARPLNLGVM